MIQCKFTCVSVTKRKGYGLGHDFVFDAEFLAVTKDNHRGRIYKDRAQQDASVAEDAAFFAATPSGSLRVSTIAADVFAVGEDYYLEVRLVGGGE